MRPVIEILEERISATMASVSEQENCRAIVRPSGDAKFGDYQANGVMGLAKKLKTNPRKLAEDVVAQLDVSDICESPEVAGPGFINLRLKPDFVAARMLEINSDSANLAVEKVGAPKTVVVDFSSPNIAKQMHVGHLRSTIIGDCICRMLEFLGHKVIRQNHIGDWGTQFGRVILGLWHMCMAEKQGEPLYYYSELEELKAISDDSTKLEPICKRIRDRHEADWRADLADGNRLFGSFLEKIAAFHENKLWSAFLVAYQYVNALEEAIAAMGLEIPTIIDGQEKSIPYEFLSRRITAMLQEGGKLNEQELKAWRIIRELTLEQCNTIYKMLVVTLGDDDVRGESSYNDALPSVVTDLKKQGMAVESDGAVCVFPDGFKNKQGEPLPFIIQKSDGAYLYATTDLAALRYRVDDLKADTIVYVTDSRQKMHFEMLFAVAAKARWAGDDLELSHVMFGSILGDDGTPLKTRSGENVKLRELLDEAVERAMAVVEQKNPDLPADKKTEIARAVGIGAVKYADYSNNRTSDYVFSFDKMLAMEGNTAPYMQYAYARIRSIERKAQSKGVDIAAELSGLETPNLSEPGEFELAKHLIRYGEAIRDAAADYRPNYLTNYLYELAQKFSAFYASCPVLDAGSDKRPTRLLLCDLTANTIGHGLHDLLGISVVEQM